jgi:hypothetical protein
MGAWAKNRVVKFSKAKKKWKFPGKIGKVDRKILMRQKTLKPAKNCEKLTFKHCNRLHTVFLSALSTISLLSKKMLPKKLKRRIFFGQLKPGRDDNFAPKTQI